MLTREFGWLLGRGRAGTVLTPPNGATADFLCGQIDGHYAPKLGLNCASGNEPGCSNATALTTTHSVLRRRFGVFL